MAIYERSGSTSPAQPSSAPPSYEPDYNSEIEMGKNQNRKGFAVKLILCVFIGFGMLGAVIYSRVELLQISNEITQTEKNYTDLQSENVRMQSEIASNTSSKNIQEYAENVLGMNPLNQSQVEYVQIQTNDVVEIPAEEQNFFVRIRLWFESFVEYLRG